MRIYEAAALAAMLLCAYPVAAQAHTSSDSTAHTKPTWVTFPAKGHRVSYRVESNLLVKDKQGKEVLPAKWREIHRHLLPVGTTWVYLFKLRYRTPVKLAAVRNGKAYYDVDDGKKHVTEDIATYHRMDQPRSPHLPFPLHPGDHWKGKYSENYRIADISGRSFPITEQGDTYSKVVGVSEVHALAGAFVAYAIDRRISWVKKDASAKGDPKHMQHPVHGFTREIMWYAPKAGRVVLQGSMSAGQEVYLEGAPDEFMHNAGVTAIELETMRRPGQDGRKNVSKTPSSVK